MKSYDGRNNFNKMNHIILQEINIEGSKIQFQFSVSQGLSHLFSTNSLWIEYNQSIEEVPESILTIPFVSCLLPIMWVTDSVLWIKSLDYTFYETTFNLRRAYQELYPDYPLKGRLVPCNIVENHIEKSCDSFLLFSGGVDAHTSFIRNRNRISHLVNIQGWYKSITDQNKAANADRYYVSEFSNRNNLKFDFVQSNFATLILNSSYKYYAKKIGDSLWHGFLHSMAFISITIPLAYKCNCSSIIIASSFTIGDERVCASYPTTDSEYRFAQNGVTIHDGFDLSRQDKLHVLVNYQNQLQLDYPILVCSFNDKNCCTCEKCFRTILGLIAENADINQFGFYIDQPLKNFYQDYFRTHIALFGVKNESVSHWPHIKKRMKDNYPVIKEKEFVDWFLNFDFSKVKRRAVMKYYKDNFFAILNRKLFK